MEKNINKKFIGILTLSCGFLLTACDPVNSLPTAYTDSILVDGSGKAVDTKDNIMGKIYDSICSDRNEKVLDKILSELAMSKYGTYTEIVNANKSVVAKKAYINKYKEIFVRADDEKEDVQINRFDTFFEDITKRISESFYSLVTSGTYADENTGMFDEEKMYEKLKEQSYDLQPVDDSTKWNKFYVTSALTKDNAIDHVNKELYSYDETVDITGKTSDGRTVSNKARGYIEKNIFPTILKDKLVEEYIYKENYSALGRSYARKTNYVKVSINNNFNYVDYVTKAFADNFIYQEGEEELEFDYIDKTILGFEGINQDVGEENEPLIKTMEHGGTYVPFVSDDYVTYSNDINGAYYYEVLNETEREDKPVITVDPNYGDYFVTNDGMNIFSTEGEITLYPDTKLGELLDSYNKAIRAKEAGLTPTDEDKAELDKFTSSESMADALRDKILALAKEDNTTDGWFVKNGGISELPSALRDRLFNIKVANEIENGYKLEKVADRELGTYRYEGTGTTGKKITKVPYARNIEGKKLIMAANADDFEINNDNFIYNDGSSLYICQVLEAPSTSKLTQDDAKYSIDVENTARQIAKILSTKDTYVTNAYTKYLADKEGNNLFKFFDTSLHDYFKGQYPDLFAYEDK